MLADGEDPFEFVGSDQDDAPVFVKKTPPPNKKIPPSIKKTPHLDKKKSPRIVISKNSDEINEMLDIKKAIEESKKTALQEERARRYANRMLQKTASSSTSASGLESDNSTCSLTKHHRQSTIHMESEKSKAVTKKKQTRLQKEASPGGTKSDNSGRSSDNNQEDSFVKQTPIPVDIVSSSSRESSVTPTLTQTPTKKDSPVFRSRDADSSSSGSHLKSPTPTQTPTKRDSPVCSNAGISVSSGNGLKLPTVTQTPTKKDSPIFRDADSVSSSNRLKSSTPTQTPTKRDSSISSIAGSSLSSNRLKLKRKRLPNISKEPSIKLSRVDTEFVASLKKPKPDQQKANQVSCDNNINANGTTSNSTEIVTSVLMTSQNEKDGDKVPKQLKTKGKETVKTKIGKGKKSLWDTPKCHLKKCPSLYAPRGTSARDYLPVIVRFFEDFKLQLQMAQNQCITFVPRSNPVTTSKRQWQADKDDGKSTINKSGSTSLPLTLTLPCNSTVKEQPKETRSKKATVEEVVDSLWQWDCHGFDSDDQRLFYDSDPNIDPKTSQTTNNTLDQTPPRATAIVTSSKHMENLSPFNKDISIDISSSNSNESSVIQPGRRKRRLLGRRIAGSSDATLTGDKQCHSSRQSFTSSLPRPSVHRRHTLSSSSSPNITDIDEGPEQPSTELYNKKSVIDLTELEETAEVDSCGSPRFSQEKQVACPVCQQQFSEAYITIHAADCELHVDSDRNTGRLLPTSSSKLRQTTLTHEPLSINTQRKKVIESDSDAEELIPPIKKRKTRKLLPDNSKKIPLVYSKEIDTIDHRDVDVQQKQNYLIGTDRSASTSTTTTTTTTNSVFKSTSLVEQALEEIESYSSDDNELADPTGSSLIDYKNQFSAKSVGKVSKELLTEDNDAFLLARKKKWMNTKKGGKERQGRWRKF